MSCNQQAHQPDKHDEQTLAGGDSEDSMSGKKICNNQDVEANVGSDNHSSPNTELKPKQRSHKSSTEPRLCQRKFYEECPSSAITDTIYTAGVTGMDFWEISETSLNGGKDFSKGRVELQIRDRFDLTDFAEIAYQAKEVIAQKFGEEILKLHYALAIIAFRKPEAWREEMTVSASKLLDDFGEAQKRNHYIRKANRSQDSKPTQYLSKTEKLQQISHQAQLLRRIEVCVREWRYKEKNILSVRMSHLWDIFEIHEIVQPSLDGKDTFIDVEITFRPGLWFNKFANHAYLREFGYITSEALKLDPYREKLALRLAYFTLFALQQHKSGRYQIETLLTRIGYGKEIVAAKTDRVAALHLKRSFDRGLKTLGNFESPYRFDYDPDVPDWVHPDRKVKKPNHWFETWLQLNGTLRQPEALPKRLKPEPEQPQQAKKTRCKRKSAQPTPNLAEPIAFGQQVREARKAMGESLRVMAKRVEISPSQLSQIENGCYPRTLKPSLKTKILEHLGLTDE